MGSLTVTVHPLDNPTADSLRHAHAGLAQTHGRAARYRGEVSPFFAFPDEMDETAWNDVRALTEPDETVLVAGFTDPAPAGWAVVADIPGVQLTGEAVRGATRSEAVPLGPEDVDEMLALVERTRPGPFRPGTIDMGAYLGIRQDGKLVAMAGERMHPPGWTEVSAVCTAPEYRGRGYGTALVLAVVAGIQARGETAFMHAASSNTNAIRLYESLGFRRRREINFRVLRPPADGLNGARSLDQPAAPP